MCEKEEGVRVRQFIEIITTLFLQAEFSCPPWDKLQILHIQLQVYITFSYSKGMATD